MARAGRSERCSCPRSSRRGTRSSTRARQGPEGCDVAIDFTRPDAVGANVDACLAAGIPVVIGTSGFDVEAVDAAARGAGVPCFYAPNFALGAALMMRFAEEAAKVFPRAEIVELHAETKLDAPSGTAKATAARMGTEPADPLRAAARPRRAPGGRLRRTGGDAHDSARHDLARSVRPRRPAGGREGT